jgi:hypothetical protein
MLLSTIFHVFWKILSQQNHRNPAFLVPQNEWILYCSSGLALRGAGHSGRAAPALWDSLMPARKGPAHGDAPNMSTGWWYTYPSEKYES